jgi:hypothetical protein
VGILSRLPVVRTVRVSNVAGLGAAVNIELITAVSILGLLVICWAVAMGPAQQYVGAE